VIQNRDGGLRAAIMFKERRQAVVVADLPPRRAMDISLSWKKERRAAICLV
jgi:hypothetical protein